MHLATSPSPVGCAPSREQVASLKEELDSTVDDIGTLVEAGNGTAACIANIVAKVGAAKLGQCHPDEGQKRLCEPTEDPPGGKAHGTARSPGATRTYTCDKGLVMAGKAHSFCTAGLAWVPAAPTCTQMVTCNIVMDKDLHAV